MWKRQWFVPVAVGLILLVTLAATIGGLLDSAAFLALIGVALGALLSDYSTQRSGELERTHQLRLAALDRRLQAHQDAYALWRRMRFGGVSSSTFTTLRKHLESPVSARNGGTGTVSTLSPALERRSPVPI